MRLAQSGMVGKSKNIKGAAEIFKNIPVLLHVLLLRIETRCFLENIKKLLHFC
jgi:hypothetical protein